MIDSELIKRRKRDNAAYDGSTVDDEEEAKLFDNNELAHQIGSYVSSIGSENLAAGRQQQQQCCRTTAELGNRVCAHDKSSIQFAIINLRSSRIIRPAQTAQTTTTTTSRNQQAFGTTNYYDLDGRSAPLAVAKPTTKSLSVARFDVGRAGQTSMLRLQFNSPPALSKQEMAPSHAKCALMHERKRRRDDRVGKGFRKGKRIENNILLALFVLLLLPDCLVLLLRLPNIRCASASAAAPVATKLYHTTDDGDTDMSPSATQMPQSSDDGNNSDTDNYTQIPFEYNNKISATTAATSLAGSTQKPAHLRKAPLLRVAESELLPFNEFNVQQPTFSDLMRSWPPTTQQAAYLAASESSPSQAPKYAVGNRQNSRAHQNPSHRAAPHLQKAPNDYATSGGADTEPQLMRNHLNEDLDDTIVTADQGFERDQMAEPPTLINYLGDLGDYIYVQLRQHFDGSGGNIAAASVDATASGEAQSSEANNNSADPDNESMSGGGGSKPRKQPQQQQQQPPKVEAIDELLDDHYYDQYENSQVLYYGPQLVREGDIFELGCYLPTDHKAEWTKSGRALVNNDDDDDNNNSKSGGSPRVVRQNDFLGAKQNFSLKIFEASLSDSGNYRCSRMSRKYHKLVVVPLKTSTSQLFVIQQRLLSVVNPKLVSAPQLAAGGSHLLPAGATAGRQSALAASALRQPTARQLANKSKRANGYLLPGYLIVEDQPLIVSCNISDEFVLRRLRENPQFQLAWYKNGKQLRGSLHTAQGGGFSPSPPSQHSASGAGQSPAAIQVQIGRSGGQPASTKARGQPFARFASSAQLPASASQRVQFLQANGRQLYITSALYSDAGDYLCSWSKLPARQQQSGDPLDESGDLSSSAAAAANNNNNNNNSDEMRSTQTFGSSIAGNPLAAGSLVQLLAPARLRPFKSTYYARQGNELRLACQLQRGYPPAQIAWYAGNRLVDAKFLREHGAEFRVLQLSNQNQVIVTSGAAAAADHAPPDSSGSSQDGGGAGRKRIVEINPIPASRQQMSLTTNGRGQWVEYRDPKSEKYAIETPEQQLKYLQQKLVQLNGLSGAAAAAQSAAGGQPSAAASAADPQAASLFGQTSVSVLVINSLNIDKHTSRYACRATTRANTDEVTTVVRVQASSTVMVRPSTGRATLIPGQPLHFQCEIIGNRIAEFLWYKRAIGTEHEDVLEPNNDDTIQIHNNRLTLVKPTLSMAGDYVCRGLKEDDKSSTDPNEYAIIKVRTQPYIEDFGQETSHTGKSSTIIDGERLELTCTVRDKITPVNITWLRSRTPDDDSKMDPLMEIPPPDDQTDELSSIQTIIAEQGATIETVGQHTKKLVIESIKPEQRGFYVCLVDNGVTERTRKMIFIRVKDKLIALWPFLGIVAELFILFTIIHIWETQRAYKEIQTAVPQVNAANKRPASGPSGASEIAPLTSG